MNVWTVHWDKKKSGYCREVAVSGGSTVFHLPVYYFIYTVEINGVFQHILDVKKFLEREKQIKEINQGREI